MDFPISIADALQSIRPGAQWSMTGNTYEGITWHDTTQTIPTIVEVFDEVNRLSRQQPLVSCKKKATELLAATDYTQLPDAAAALKNKAAFDTYRATVRGFIVNPVASPTWPALPKAQW
jgi:hypothetical protein